MSEMITLIAVTVPVTLIVVSWLLVGIGAVLDRVVRTRSPRLLEPGRDRSAPDVQGDPFALQ